MANPAVFSPTKNSTWTNGVGLTTSDCIDVTFAILWHEMFANKTEGKKWKKVFQLHLKNNKSVHVLSIILPLISFIYPHNDSM